MYCVLHPAYLAVDTCVSCGHFVCTDCAEGGMQQQRCPACRASAQTEAASGGSLVQLHSAPLSLGALCSAAWGAFQREPVMLSTAAFVSIFLGGLVDIPGKILDRVYDDAEVEGTRALVLGGVMILLAWLQLGVQGPLRMGQLRMGARALAAEPVDALTPLFGQWHTLPRYLACVALAFGVFAIPAVLIGIGLAVCAELAGYEPAVLYGAAAFALSPLFLWLALPLLLLNGVFAWEPGVGPVAALGRCFALAQRRRLLLLGVGTLSASALAVGFLACCIGIVPAHAFVQTLLAATYLRLREEEQVHAS